MDNQKVIKDRITAYLKDAVRAVQVENVETVETIGSKETTNAICYAMEAIFLHGLKGSSTNKNFWPLAKKFTHKATLSVITELSQISTDVGKCRAWIRLAFNDGALDSYCKVITTDTSTIRNYYDSYAYFRDVEQCNAMETHLQGLCNFIFNLAYNSTVLNQWTTTSLVLSGLTASGHLDWPRTASAANESFSSQSALSVDLQRHPLHSRSPIPFSSALPTSASCPQGLSDAAYDSSLQLSQSDIDAIRSMSSAFRDCSETPLSMLSRPDFTENQPAIYSQITYAITSDSDQESVDPERVDEQRDLRFERIVRTNLDRYPLDFDRNQTDVPGKALNANVTVDRVKDASDIGQPKGDDKASDEGKSKAKKISNPFEDDGSASTDCGSGVNDKRLDNTKTEAPQLEGAGGNPFEEEKSDVVEQIDDNMKVADVESPKKEPAAVHRRSNCVRIKGAKNGDTKRNVVRQKVGHVEASVPDEAPLSGGMRVAHEVKVPEASNRAEETNSKQTEVSGEVEKFDRSQSPDDDFDDDLDLPRRLREETSPNNLKRKEGCGRRASLKKSFNTMLKAYIPSAAQTKIRTLDAIIDNLPHFDESGETVQEDEQSSGWASSGTVDTCDSSVDDRTEQQAEFLYQISVERGLSQQCYQCRNCATAIGMFYDRDRVCAFDGYHYCHECHENKEHRIPAKVVYNWDFRPYKVSNLSYEYLQKTFETPLLDIERLNIKLYGHVKPLDSILALRTQLRFVKSYMMTCTQAVGLEFMDQFNGQTYLFDKIHLYSLKDLTLVPSDSLQKRLQKIVKFATGHVYGCPRCCQKGFYCEICRAPKVIYPFQTSSTFRCPDCKSVYHSHCKTHMVPCPKCKRMSERENSLQKPEGGSDPIDSVDYSYQLENGNCHRPT